MSRLTRSLRAKSARITRKQHGGADWFTPTIEVDWPKVLTDAGLSAVIPMFDTSNPEKTKAWLEALVHQDELMLAGLKVITDKHVNSDDILDIIKKPEILTDFKNMFTQLIKLLTFNGSVNATSKFEKMFSMIEGELAGLLLNPGRIENLLVQGLAHIIITLLDEDNYKTIQDKLRNDRDNILQDLLMNKYSLFVTSYVTTISNTTLRDGWVINGPCVDQNDRVTGHDKESMNSLFTTLRESIKGTVNANSYGALAYTYLELRRAGNITIDSIITKLANMPPLNNVPTDTFPNDIDDNLAAIKAKYGDSVSLTFILHLHGCVERFSVGTKLVTNLPLA